MIHEAFNKSEVVKRYYLLKTGEEIDGQTAVNRWRMLRQPDKKVLNKVIADIAKEQKNIIKKA